MSLQSHKRIGEVDIVKLVASIVIMLYHIGLCSRGALAVEVFAVISGMLMVNSIRRDKLDCNVKELIKANIKFVVRKIKLFYPELLGSTILSIICYNYFNKTIVVNIDFILNSLLGEALLLRMSGLIHPSTNPAWYLSSMVMSMILIYPFVKFFRSTVWCLLLGIVLYGYLCYEIGDVHRLHYAEWVGFTYCGNIRILSELLIAAGFFPLIEKLRSVMLRKTEYYRIISICQYSALSGMFALFWFNWGCFDILFVLLTLVWCVCVFSRANYPRKHRNWEDSKFVKLCGIASLLVYLTHWTAKRAAGWVYIKFSLPYWAMVLLVIIFTAIFSLCTYWFSLIIRNTRYMKQPLIRQ